MSNHFISSDFEKNPELKKDLGQVRGMISEQANKQPIPERFVCTPDEHKPQMWIKDTVTGKETCVSLYAYGPVRKALNDLYAEKD